ncbi:MAG TPA: SDR family oxidoreductase [Burkholderiaceae bacterium]
MGAIWITGAGGAIGGALVQELQQQGRPLILTGRHPEALLPLAQSLAVPAKVVAADLEQRGAAAAALETAAGEFESIDGFVHCVGSSLIRPLHLTSDDDLEAVMRVNFFSAAWALKAFLALQVKRQCPASAVLLGSVVAQAGFPSHEAIGAAKGAVASLAQSAAATYADKGIRVNCVHPGLTISKLSARLTGSAEAVARNSRLNPMGAVGEGRDAAAMIAFLLSDKARWITGQQISVDGGHAALHPLVKA